MSDAALFKVMSRAIFIMASMIAIAVSMYFFGKYAWLPGLISAIAISALVFLVELFKAVHEHWGEDEW